MSGDLGAICIEALVAKIVIKNFVIQYQPDEIYGQELLLKVNLFSIH